MHFPRGFGHDQGPGEQRSTVPRDDRMAGPERPGAPLHRLAFPSEVPLNSPTDESNPTARGGPGRSIRSFVVRAGRMGPGQRRALKELGPRFVLPFSFERCRFEEAFGRVAPQILEIGFGMGDATAQIARALPDTDFIAIDVHAPGVGALLKRMGALCLGNLRLIQHDAVEVVEHMIGPASLAGVHVFFPDPWHKKKHNKRRLIQPGFVRLLSSRVAPGGYIHCATDWQPYAQQMLEVLGAEASLRNTVSGFAARPAYRPLTKFEHRGLTLGHNVSDLVFVKRG